MRPVAWKTWWEILRERATREYEDRLKHMRIEPESGNRHIPAMVATGTSAQTTLVEFAGNGDSQAGRNQRALWLHHVVVDWDEAHTKAAKRTMTSLSDDLASTLLLTNFCDREPSAAKMP